MKKTRIFVLISSAFLMISVSACNTLEGAGRDLQEAGKAIEDAVN